MFADESLTRTQQSSDRNLNAPPQPRRDAEVAVGLRIQVAMRDEQIHKR